MNDLKKVLPVGIVAVLVVCVIVGGWLFVRSRLQEVSPASPPQNTQTTSTQTTPSTLGQQTTSTTSTTTTSTTPKAGSPSSLGKKTWYWVSTVFSGGTRVIPKKPGVFSVTFDTQKKMITIHTDCNGAGADYVLNENKLSFIGLRSTQMFCEQSQELAFTSVLSETAGYHFLSTGGLALDLKNGSGTMFFR